MNDLTPDDLAFIRATGRDPAELTAQLAMLRGGWQSLRLGRPTTLDDGIVRLDEESVAQARERHRRAAAAGRISSFVPASGSGTRMFQSLLALHREGASDLGQLRTEAAAGDATARDALVVLEHVREFAIWPALERRGVSAASLRDVLDALVGEGGLRCHELPKGLIPYHRYGGDRVRTAFAEHLREAAMLGMSAEGECRVHFTVSDAHRAMFEEAARREAAELERELGTRFEIRFSVQAPETDAVGVDAEGQVLRDASGRIAFRPGGHGALLVNLAEHAGDIVLIKNVDNIARQEFQERIADARRLISGLLLLVEQEVHARVRELRDGGDARASLDLLERRFGIRPAGDAGTAALRDWALTQLDRPLRVCGVVATQDHAGGRPFWVSTPGRGDTLQLVEGAEVNLERPEERELFQQSRHFNPVDIACSLRDVDGRPFDLRRFVVAERALIARKAVGGRMSTVYEHPGLWNGGMGLWNTVFVEVPGFTFNPVKSLADLWTPAHRGGEAGPAT